MRAHAGVLERHLEEVPAAAAARARRDLELSLGARIAQRDHRPASSPVGPAAVARVPLAPDRRDRLEQRPALDAHAHELERTAAGGGAGGGPGAEPLRMVPRRPYRVCHPVCGNAAGPPASTSRMTDRRH